MALEFDTAAARTEGEIEWIDFHINEKDADGKIVKRVACRATKPDDGQLAVTLAQVGRFASVAQKVGAAIDFVMTVCDEETANYIAKRMMDRSDRFGLEDITPIMEGLMEEWAGRPTQ